jgi:cytoskeleton protein RodZ
MGPGDAADGTVQPADQSQALAAAVADTPGELLRVERERRGLSVQQAADELHLDAHLVSAIEGNHFHVLGAPVYAKGHLRKYASLLGFQPEVVIALYQTLGDVPAVPKVMPLTASPPRERISLRVPMRIVAALLIGAVAWWLAAWWMDHRRTGEPAATSQSVTTADGTSESIAVQMNAGASEPLAAGESEAAPQVEGSPSVESAQPAATGAFTIRLHFISASWAEVYDASGKRLMFDIGQPGQTRSVSGTPPLTVNLGMASAVSLEANNRAITIPRQPGKDATKFVLAADGSVK